MTAAGLGAIDRKQLQALLRAYFRMSSRGLALLRSRDGMPTSLTLALALYAFMGLVLGTMAISRVDALSYAIVLHWMTFLIVGMAAVVESNDVLFDPKEDEIVLPLPVHPSTLLAAKGLALVGFTSMLAAALNFFPTIVGWRALGATPWFPLVHIASIEMLVVFSCAAVICTYGIALRVLGRERFDNAAVYAQIVMVFVFMGGYQLLPRFMPEHGDPRAESTLVRFLLATPPAWFASIDATLAGGVTASEARLCAGLALISTLCLSWLAVGKLSTGQGDLAPQRADAPIADHRPVHDPARVVDGDRGTSESKARSEPRRGIWNPVAHFWLRDHVERGAFRLASAYMRRDREIKLRLYPQLGMFGMIIVMQAMDRSDHRGPFLGLLMLAIAGTVPLTAIESLRTSTHHAAADLFRYSPIAGASSLFQGVRKASIVYVQAPLIAVSAVVIALSATDTRGAFELALPVVLAMPTVSLLPGAFGAFLPLSQPPRRGEQSSRNVGVSFAMLLFMFAPLGLAYLAREIGALWPMIAVELVALVIAHRWLTSLIRARPMKNVE